MTARQDTALRKFDAVLFDVDDTLFDRRAAFARWAGKYLREIVGLRSSAAIASAIAEAESAPEAAYGSRIELVRRLMTIMPPKDKTYSFEAADREYTAEIRLDTEASELLLCLENHAFPFGIVTNGGRRQSEKVKILGLAKRTDCLFVSGEFGYDKPDPRIFLAASERLGVQPERILFVGDHPVNDIWGAQQVGMAAAWLPNGQKWPTDLSGCGPDFILDTLSDIYNIISGT